LIVPKTISDEDLRNSAGFRTKSRIPTLCWYDREHKSSIWRSSQTKSGIYQNRNSFDEKLLKEIAETSNGKICIFDARPYLNAFANKVKNILK
jgi:myotubularin-related protein 1/2